MSSTGKPTPGVDESALALVADRWSLWLLLVLRAGAGTRFSDLAAQEGLSRRVLTEKLERLRSAGLVETERYSARPPRHHYLLTERGEVVQRLGLALVHVAGGGSIGPLRTTGAPTATAPVTPAPPQTPVAQPADDAHPSARLLESDVDYAWTIYQQTVAPLVRYDEQYRTPLVETLEVYLASDASTSVTAAQLYAHRHTIRYRLGRIRELTSLDVDSLADRERLSLGLRAMHMFRRMGRELV